MSVITFALLVAMTGALSSTPPQMPYAPLASFVENRGQWRVPARYFLRSLGLDLWVGDSSLILHQHRSVTIDSLRLGPAGARVPIHAHRSGSVVRMTFVNSSGATPVPIDTLPGLLRYYVGERKNWIEAVHRFGRLRSPDLYPGIDLELSRAGGPRYSFLVHPGADPSRIQWRFDGADQADFLDDMLSIPTSIGRIEHRGLMAYQIAGSVRQTVSCRFVRREKGVGFLVGDYDRTLPLVIDPILFSIVIGGSDYERPGATVVDRDGNILIVGTTQSVDLPVTEGAYDGTFEAPTEAFAMKIDIGRTPHLVWATYLGGEAGEGGNAAALTLDNGLVAAGLTASATFPATDSVVSASFGGGIDAFAARLSSEGVLRFSTYLGDGGIDAASALAVDRDTIVVAGSTTSVNFPAEQRELDTMQKGGEAFVLKLTPNGQRVISGIAIGGSGEDYCYALVRGIDDSYLLGGVTLSDDLPVTPKAFQKTPARGDTSRFDFLIGRINSDLDSIIALTYLGGKGDENGTRIAISPDGAIVVGGYTLSSDFPTTSKSVGQKFQGDFDMVVALLSPDLSSMRYGCYLGGVEQDRLFAITATSRDRLLLIGDTRSSTMPATFGAYDTSYNGSSDIYLGILNPLSDSIIYSTYLGGSASDIGYAIHQTGARQYLLCGVTGSVDFPTTVSPHDSLNYTDLFVLRLQIPDTGAASSVRSVRAISAPSPTLSARRVGGRLYVAMDLPCRTTTAIDLYDLSGRRLRTIAPTLTYEAGRYDFQIEVDDAPCVIGWRYGGVVL